MAILVSSKGEMAHGVWSLCTTLSGRAQSFELERSRHWLLRVLLTATTW